MCTPDPFKPIEKRKEKKRKEKKQKTPSKCMIALQKRLTPLMLIQQQYYNLNHAGGPGVSQPPATSTH
jgi:hypothetical protein